MSEAGGDLTSALLQSLADVRAATSLETAHSRLRWSEMLAASLLDQQKNAPHLASHRKALMQLARAAGILAEDVESLAFRVERDEVAAPLLHALLRSERAYTLSRAEAEHSKPVAPPAPPPIEPQDLAPHLSIDFPQSIIRDLVGISGGYSKRTFLVRLTLATGEERELILRQDLLGAPPFGTSVVDEFHLLQTLAKTDLPVARPLRLVPAGSALGGAFIITDKLPGRTVGRNVLGFDPLGDKRTIALEIAMLLARVHSVDASELIPADESTVTGNERVRRQVEDFQELWVRHRSKSSFPLALGYCWLKKNLNCGVGGSSLIHGDLSLANVLVTGTKVTGIVDWEFWHLGDPAEDLAYCRSVMQTAVSWDEFLAAYVSAGGRAIPQSRLTFLSVFSKFRLAIMCRISGQLFEAGKLSEPVYAASAAAIAPALEAEMLEEIAASSVEDGL